MTWTIASVEKSLNESTLYIKIPSPLQISIAWIYTNRPVVETLKHSLLKRLTLIMNAERTKHFTAKQ